MGKKDYPVLRLWGSLFVLLFASKKLLHADFSLHPLK